MMRIFIATALMFFSLIQGNPVLAQQPTPDPLAAARAAVGKVEALIPKGGGIAIVRQGSCYAFGNGQGLMTAYHVVDGATAKNVTVTIQGQNFHPVEIAGTAAGDFCLMMAPKTVNLSFLSTDRTAAYHEGTPVFAMAYDPNTGAVTSLPGTITRSLARFANSPLYVTLISSKVRPGMSGGVVVDSNGKAMGTILRAITDDKIQKGGGGIFVPFKQPTPWPK